MSSINGHHHFGIIILHNHSLSSATSVGPLRLYCLPLLLWLLVSTAPGVAGDSTPADAPISPGGDTNSQQLARVLWQLEGQVRSNQVALEQSGREAREAAARNAEAIARGLQRIESSFSAQQQVLAARTAEELHAIRRSNGQALTIAGIFGVLACLALGVMSWFQWRISRTWAGMTVLWPGLPGNASGAVQDTNRRLLGSMDRLEKRLQQLEQTIPRALKEPGTSLPSEGNGDSGNGAEQDPARISEPGHDRIATLIGEGKAKLKQNDLESALRCFEEVLQLAPNHSEALVKKGAALEGLHKLNEAFECYDQAIASDDSMTLAYLHKGGLCNRLERFKEALECYEKALRTQERHG